MSDHRITVYGPRPEGVRNLSVDLDGVRVLLSPADERGQRNAERIAVFLLDGETDRDVLLGRIRALESEADALRDRLRSARANADSAEKRAIAATAGRRRFFGPVLLRPAFPDAWDGEVWLLDPDKQERGTALRFASLADVRAMHPELWVVSVSSDGVLLDAWGGSENRSAA